MKDEEKSRTGNHAKADSGSGPEEEKNNETKGMPDNEPEKEPGNESEESEKGRRLAMGISMGIIFGVVFGKTIFGTWAQALP